jgi:hypothetical protein
MQRDIQEHCQEASNKRFWWEWHVDHVIELSEDTTISWASSSMNGTKLVKISNQRERVISSYPSCTSVDWAITMNCCVLIEVLWYWKAHENREPKNKLRFEAV